MTDRTTGANDEGRGMLTDTQLHSLALRGFTRRGLLRVAGLVAAGATLPFASEPALAQLSSLGGRLPEGSVKINANEFPDGPTPKALDALLRAARSGNRYQYPETFDLIAKLAELEGLPETCFAAYPGSSLALQHGVIAFTSPQRALVTVDPGFEAAARAAEFIGAPVVRVPLRADGAHDLRKMRDIAREQDAGLIYVCSPNNPTGAVTPRSEIDWLIANKPADAKILLDEAYIHFCDEKPGGDLVQAEKDVVVIRTFSKIYGMAGLRAGYTMARPDLVKAVAGWKSGAMPATAMAAAHAMLGEPELVGARKAANTKRRDALMAFFDEHGFAYTPSRSSKLMVDTGKPTKTVIDAMAKRGVYIGRPWPVWPTHARISLGSDADMERFRAAFLEVTRS